jgi:hypothetical protein
VNRDVTLLGPQRRPSLQNVVRDLDADAPIATVTAGWLEREHDDAELREMLGGRGMNLGLHGRWLELHEHDREFAHAERDHDLALAELRGMYLSRLDHALQAAFALGNPHETRPRLSAAAFEDAVEVIRLVDRQHLTRIREAQQAFYSAWRPEERPAIAHHREEIRGVLAQAQAVIVAGGHVGELLRVLHLFHVEPHLPRRVIAWSAGAMALSERVVLFHDFVPHGVAQTEVLGEGLGVVRDLVLLPHARRRLRVDDQVRMSVLARRFGPAPCLVLDDELRVDLTSEGRLPPDARVIAADGRVTATDAA